MKLVNLTEYKAKKTTNRDADLCISIWVDGDAVLSTQISGSMPLDTEDDLIDVLHKTIQSVGDVGFILEQYAEGANIQITRSTEPVFSVNVFRGGAIEGRVMHFWVDEGEKKFVSRVHSAAQVMFRFTKTFFHLGWLAFLLVFWPSKLK